MTTATATPVTADAVDPASGTALLVVAPVSPLQRFGEGGDDLEALRALYLDPLARLLGPGLCSAPKALIGGGHAGTAAALEQASVLLERRAADRVLVVAADSILDDLSLGWLLDNGRLHSDDTPTGLIPGEAAAAVLLEPAPDAVRRGAHIHLVLQSVVTDREPEGGADSEASASARGFALGRAIRRSLADRTGAEGRGASAREFAMAQHGASERTLRALEDLLEGIASERTLDRGRVFGQTGAS